MEGYQDGRKLAETMKRVSLKKPIVVLKVGRSALGANAANSHTGSMAGSDQVYDAVFKQCGVIRVDTIDELIDTMQAFDRMPLPAGGHTFLLTQAIRFSYSSSFAACASGCSAAYCGSF